MSRPRYLDNAATTPVDPRVAAVMAECLTEQGEFGNPSSDSHSYGARALERVERAREQLARSIGAAPTEILWTSGATEANNLAIFGIANYYRDAGRHLVTARTEHKAVLDPCRELERRGWQVSYLMPDRGGVIDPQQLAAVLRADTMLVSIMHVNNETGVIQDIAAIAALCKRQGTRLHVDAAQSLGKQRLEFCTWGVDLMSLSAHKAYGPKGVGALAVSGTREDGVHLRALQFGGGQERGLRPGTVATHQVAGMGVAATLAVAEQAAESARLAELQSQLWKGLEAIGGVIRNGEPTRSVPHLLNVSFQGVHGESLMAAVQGEIAVSSGAACMSAAQEPSYVLRALGRNDAEAESSLRFSLGRFTRQSDIEAAIAVLAAQVPRLRRLSPP